MRLGGGAGCQGLDAGGFYGDYAILILQHAVDQQETLASSTPRIIAGL